MKYTTEPVGPEPVVPETLSYHVLLPAASFILFSNFRHALKSPSPHSSPRFTWYPHSYLMKKREATRLTPSSDYMVNKLTCAYIFRFLLPSLTTEEVSLGLPPPRRECKGCFCILTSFFLLAAWNTVDHLKFLSHSLLLARLSLAHFLLVLFRVASWFYASGSAFGVFISSVSLLNPLVPLDSTWPSLHFFT